MPDPVQISVTSGADRLNRREQIEAVLARAVTRNEPVRIRIPLTLYDYTNARGYEFIRDATWNLQLPLAQTSVETVEELIETIGKCIVAIAEEGSQKVREKLERPLGEQP